MSEARRREKGGGEQSLKFELHCQVSLMWEREGEQLTHQFQDTL